VPKTCGCRRTVLTSRRQTFSKSNGPVPSPVGSGKRPASANPKFLGHFVVVAGSWHQSIHRPLRWRAAERVMVLLAVPRTARRRAQPGHDFKQIFIAALRFIFLENIENPNIERQHRMGSVVAKNSEFIWMFRCSMFSDYKITRSSRCTTSTREFPAAHLVGAELRDAAREFRSVQIANPHDIAAANSPSQRATPAAADSCLLAQGQLRAFIHEQRTWDDGKSIQRLRPCNFVGCATNSVPSSSPARILRAPAFFCPTR